MQPKKTFRDEIRIHALTTKIWNVLTCSDYTSQYLFDSEMVANWVKDGEIIWQSEKEGSLQPVKKGKIHQIIPGICIQFSIHDLQEPQMEEITVTYELLPEEDSINLRLTQEVPFHSTEVFNLLVENWRMILQKIKWLAEYS